MSSMISIVMISINHIIENGKLRLAIRGSHGTVKPINISIWAPWLCNSFVFSVLAGFDSCPRQTLHNEIQQCAFGHVPESIYGLPATKIFRPVQPQIHNTRTRLCLSWPKIRYSWTRIRPFWRPKIHYFPDKHKAELQGAWWRCTLCNWRWERQLWY